MIFLSFHFHKDLFYLKNFLKNLCIYLCLLYLIDFSLFSFLWSCNHLSKFEELVSVRGGCRVGSFICDNLWSFLWINRLILYIKNTFFTFYPFFSFFWDWKKLDNDSVDLVDWSNPSIENLFFFSCGDNNVVGGLFRSMNVIFY
jgi:hypothetical protein